MLYRVVRVYGAFYVAPTPRGFSEAEVAQVAADAANAHAPLVKALRRAQRVFDEALPKFNWGASALDGNAIELLNDERAEFEKYARDNMGVVDLTRRPEYSSQGFYVDKTIDAVFAGWQARITYVSKEAR